MYVHYKMYVFRHVDKGVLLDYKYHHSALHSADESSTLVDYTHHQFFIIFILVRKKVGETIALPAVFCLLVKFFVFSFLFYCVLLFFLIILRQK